MKAQIIQINPQNPQEDKIKTVSKTLRNGGLVIIPTETVYGIAADMRNKQVMDRLYKIKERPKDKPFSVIIDDKEKVDDLAVDLSRIACKLIDKFWPGPLTAVLNSKNGGTIGIRMPDNNIALSLIAAVGAPLVCPSANLAGKPAPVSLQEAIEDLGEEVDMAVDGGDSIIGIESSVVDFTEPPYKILREGAISSEEIRLAAYKKNVLFICTGNSCRSVMAQAYLEKRIQESNRNDIEVSSAGILGVPTIGVSAQTRTVLANEGMDMSNHRSSRVNNLMLKKADIILVMERMHEERILELQPEVKNRLFLLREFVHVEASSVGMGISSDTLDIDDPIGQSIGFHESTFFVIKEAVDRLLMIL